MKPKQQKPGPGQESVWEYPTPPVVEDVYKHVQVVFNGIVIADSRQSVRVLETGHPPVYYIPPDDVMLECLEKSDRTTQCEWKGDAYYYNLSVGGRTVENAAWYYPDPKPGFLRIKTYIAFYPQQMDACMVDGEIAQPQPGGYYGGWITKEIVGPFKGEPESDEI